MNFDSGEPGRLCGGKAGVVKAITANSDADTVGFGFAGAKGSNKASIRDRFVGGNPVRGGEEDGVGTGGHTGSNALRKTAKVVGQGLGPNKPIRTTAEVAIFEEVAGGGVKDRIGLCRSLLGQINLLAGTQRIARRGMRMEAGAAVANNRHRRRGGAGRDWRGRFRRGHPRRCCKHPRRFGKHPLWE